MSKTFEKYTKDDFGWGIDTYNEYKNAEGTMVFNEGTEDEVLFVPIEQTGEFPILSVCVDDFEELGYDISSLPTEKVKQIANKIGDYMVDDNYWDCIRLACDFYDVPEVE